MRSLCITHIDYCIVVVLRTISCCKPSFVKPLYFPILVSLTLSSELSDPPSSTREGSGPSRTRYDPLAELSRIMDVVLDVDRSVCNISMQYTPCPPFPSTARPLTEQRRARTIVSDPDMRVVIWSGGGKGGVALPPDDLFQATHGETNKLTTNSLVYRMVNGYTARRWWH